MRTSFHHQPEAQHPIFQLSTSWQADYPIFRGIPDTRCSLTRIIRRDADISSQFGVTHNGSHNVVGLDRRLRGALGGTASHHKR